LFNILEFSFRTKQKKTLSMFICSPTDEQLNGLKNNFKIYIKIDIETAPTSFGVITIIRERTI